MKFIFGLLAASILIMDCSVLAAGDYTQLATEDDNSELLKAVDKGSVSRVAELLTAGINVNFQHEVSGETTLLRAAGKGLVKIASLLLKNGADPDLASADGTTPLMMAAALGRVEIVQLLLNAKATVCLTDELGRSALGRAGQTMERKVCSILCDRILQHVSQAQAERYSTFLRCLARILPSPSRDIIGLLAEKARENILKENEITFACEMEKIECWNAGAANFISKSDRRPN